MIFDRVEDFAAAVPAMRALIGLDLGEKTIGVAVTDSFLSVATPLETVPTGPSALSRQTILSADIPS